MARLDEIDKRYWLMVNEEIGNIGDSDISVSCPICNEGHSWGKKHRLHLYIKDSYDSASIKCFNCGYTGNMFSFLKELHPSEYSLYVNEKKGKNLEVLKSNFLKKEPKKQELEASTINTGLSFNNLEVEDDCFEDKAVSEEIIASISTGLNLGTTKLVPNKSDGLNLVEKPEGFYPLTQEVINYINKRGLEPIENWLYSPKNNKIIFNDAKITLSDFIIVPFIKDKKWYGFQAIGYKEKKFFIYMVTGNSGHKVWNLYNVDFKEPVYIFESVFDSMSSGLKNSIGALGSSIGEETLKLLKEPVICFDNQRCDEKSKEETLKYLEKGYKCFIWPEGSEKFKDANDLRKIKVPYNKIAEMIKSNTYQGMKGILKIKLMR